MNEVKIFYIKIKQRKILLIYLNETQTRQGIIEMLTLILRYSFKTKNKHIILFVVSSLYNNYKKIYIYKKLTKKY